MIREHLKWFLEAVIKRDWGNARYYLGFLICDLTGHQRLPGARSCGYCGVYFAQYPRDLS